MIEDFVDIIDRLREEEQFKARSSIHHSCVDCGIRANLLEDAIKEIEFLRQLCLKIENERIDLALREAVRENLQIDISVYNNIWNEAIQQAADMCYSADDDVETEWDKLFKQIRNDVLTLLKKGKEMTPGNKAKILETTLNKIDYVRKELAGPWDGDPRNLGAQLRELIEKIPNKEILARELMNAFKQIEELQEALTEIANQKRSNELEDYYDADFEGGYDAIIDIARYALMKR